MRRSNEHHLFYPARDYRTKTEKAFRNLPCNRIPLDYRAHMLLHKYVQVEKPTHDEMTESIRRHRTHECGCPRPLTVVKGGIT